MYYYSDESLLSLSLTLYDAEVRTWHLQVYNSWLFPCQQPMTKTERETQ